MPAGWAAAEEPVGAAGGGCGAAVTEEEAPEQMKAGSQDLHSSEIGGWHAYQLLCYTEINLTSKFEGVLNLYFSIGLETCLE